MGDAWVQEEFPPSNAKAICAYMHERRSTLPDRLINIPGIAEHKAKVWDCLSRGGGRGRWVGEIEL